MTGPFLPLKIVDDPTFLKKVVEADSLLDYLDVPINKVRESGGTILTVGSVSEGEYLKRVGTTLVGAAGGGGGTGTVGPTGPTGVKGDTGTDGATGLAGPTGPTGVKGDTGTAGTAGSVGPTGATGIKGDTGAASTVTGPTGAVGAASTVTGPTGPNSVSTITDPTYLTILPAGLAKTEDGGDYTLGTYFRVQRACSCSGIRFGHAVSSTGGGTATCKLWRAGVAVASGTISVTTTGYYTVTFASPYAIPEADIWNVTYCVSVRVVTPYVRAQVNPFYTFPNIGSGVPAISGVAYVPLPDAQNKYHAGDAYPDTAAVGFIYAIDPILTTSLP